MCSLDHNNHHFFRFSQCEQSEIYQSVQNPHLHFRWWTCYQCHLEEKWECDNSEYYLPADQNSSWSCCRYLPDSAHHWPISESEWHCGDIQLHSGECQGKLIKDSFCISQWLVHFINNLLEPRWCVVCVLITTVNWLLTSDYTATNLDEFWSRTHARDGLLYYVVMHTILYQTMMCLILSCLHIKYALYNHNLQNLPWQLLICIW